MLEHRLTQTLISIFGDNMVIRLIFKSQKRYMKKDVKALLSVSLAAMNVPSPKPLMVDKDMYLVAREESNVPQSTHFDDFIPSVDGIPVNAFSWHGETSQGSFSFFNIRASATMLKCNMWKREGTSLE